jgi:filamentous hemagglutinin family protein
MPVRPAVFRPRRRFQPMLLASAGALTLLVAGAPAEARNILSGGGAASAVAGATASALSSAQQAAQVAQAAQNSLTRATQAIEGMLAVQSVARALALQAQSTIPDGLAPGGLQVAPGGVWQNANAPTQSSSNGQTTVTIEQTAPQAILSWQTFDVSKNTTVDFDQQGNASWVALNQIAATGVPSQILGSIKADGQVYLINPNGIIFGGSSQVNVNSLIASSATISTTQFLDYGIYSTQSGSTYNPSFTDAGGAITVAAGAEITTAAPSSLTPGGGYVLLMGTQVQNAGTIVSGQTELAAGDNFLIRPGDSTTSNEWSTTRGNEIAVQLNTPGSSTTGGSGLVGNSGYIEADTGDITLAGETVVQNGVLILTTLVNVRGTVHLLSSASDPYSSVTLTGNSFIGILPDASDGTALDSQRAVLIPDVATYDVNRGEDAAIQPGGQFDGLSTLNDLEDESGVEIVTGGTVTFQNGSLTLTNGGQVVAVSAARHVQVDTGAIIDVYRLLDGALSMLVNDIAVSTEANAQRDDCSNRGTGDRDHTPGDGRKPAGGDDAGEAGSSVSGNLTTAALQVVNAANVQVQDTATDIAAAPNIGALTAVSNTVGAADEAEMAAAAQARNRATAGDPPSIITVDVIGYGGGDGAPAPDQQNRDEQSYDPNSAIHMLGNGKLTDEEKSLLTSQEKQKLDRAVNQPGSVSSFQEATAGNHPDHRGGQFL